MEHGDPRGVYLTRGGIDRVNPDFFRMALSVYLESEVDVDTFIEDMEERYADYISFGANIDTAFEEGVSGFASVFAAIGVGILAVSSFVVALILYFVIGSTVIKQHRDLGIKKAIGYTTANLMSQVSFSFALPVLLGTVLGCIFGALMLNPIMSIGMAEMGVMSANYLVNPAWVAGTGIFIVVLAYTVSTLVTLRIRKISAYSLISE
jgi:putative ABC transport system permease protein